MNLASRSTGGFRRLMASKVVYMTRLGKLQLSCAMVRPLATLWSLLQCFPILPIINQLAPCNLDKAKILADARPFRTGSGTREGVSSVTLQHRRTNDFALFSWTSIDRAVVKRSQ